MIATVPLDPEAAEARRLLLEELARPRYRAAEPSWFDRAVTAVRDWFASLTVPEAGDAWPVAAIVGVLIVAVVVVVALVVAGAPRRRVRSARTGAVLAADDDRSADSLRASADAALARGDVDAAVVDGFRALVRSLAERDLVSITPGTTAHGFARSAIAVFPSEEAALRGAADAFDRVRYLGGHADAATAERLRALYARLGATRPEFAEPASAAS